MTSIRTCRRAKGKTYPAGLADHADRYHIYGTGHQGASDQVASWAEPGIDHPITLLQDLPMDNFFVDLNHLDLLAVTGEDSGKFLQGQLTCDINTASAGRSIRGAVCNNKGRVISSFRLLRLESDYYLEMAPGLLESSKQRLDKYIVFYKAKTSDARPRFHRLGLAGQSAREILTTVFSHLPEAPGEVSHEGDNHLILLNSESKLSPQRYELWLDAESAAPIREKINQALATAGYLQWQLLDLQLGTIEISASEVEEYTPQVLNYDLSGEVSFTKGCYTGQEIVARMHYRGNAKKRMYPVSLQSATPLENVSGLGIVQADSGLSAGVLIKLLPNGRDSYLGLALIDTQAATEDHPLMVEENRIPVSLLQPF